MSPTVSSSPSPFVREVEVITETDEQIRAVLAEAELPPLLPALAYLTGDLGVLRPELQPDPLLLAMLQWPFTLLEYWERTRQPVPDDYELSS